MEVDLAALQAEVANLSEDDIRKQLVALRTSQKVNQKKHSNSDAAKAYRKKRYESIKLMVAHAKKLGIYDEINEAAQKAADEKLGAEEAETAEALNEE